MPRHRLLTTLLCAAAAAGCATPQFHPTTPRDLQSASPLGPSYVLVPLPSDDESLLGRVLPGPIEDGRSIDAVSQPNACADQLTPAQQSPLAATFEDAQELSAGGRAKAALATFGFEGDAQEASLFHYQLEVSKQVVRTDTTGYRACCEKTGGCGYGFVSALVYGDGQYETAVESDASGSISVPIAGGAGGFVKARVLHRRKVHGYLAALVRVTDAGAAKSVGVLGDPAAAGIALDEQTLPQQVKERFDAGRIQVVAMGRGPLDTAYVFRDGSGEVTENEFIRRYESVTGSSDLSGAKSVRDKGLLAGGVALTAAGAVMLAIGIANLQQHCGPGDGSCQRAYSAAMPGGIPAGYQTVDPSSPGGLYYNPSDTTISPGFVALTAAGGLVTAGGVTMFVIGLARTDGSARSHSISKFDAELYAARYNRALLRRTVEEARSRMEQVSQAPSETPSAFQLAPVVSPAFVGLIGRF